jgi:hypothetical protein
VLIELERNKHAEQAMDRSKGREWTVRLTGPLRYRRYTGHNEANRPTIYFEFDVPPGDQRLPDAVFQVIKSVQYLERGPRHGGGTFNSGLECRRGIWRFPDTPTGRTAADVLDAKLSELASKMDEPKEPGPAR